MLPIPLLHAVLPSPWQLPAACDVYSRGVSLGGVSKTLGLPGLRIGWLASRDVETMTRVAELKVLTTLGSGIWLWDLGSGIWLWDLALGSGL